MKKMYFLKDRKEAVIDRLTYMSKHRQEYLQDKEHGMITLQFNRIKDENPPIKRGIFFEKTFF